MGELGWAGTCELPGPCLQVISGQQLPKVNETKEKSIVDPFVKVEIFGVRPDTTRQETNYVENNGERLAVPRNW